MTNSFGREQAQQAQCVRNSRVDANSDIPVLVCLPSLGELAAEVQATVETCGEAEDMRECGTSAPPQTEPLPNTEVWSWSDFRFPPPVAHVQVASGLIAASLIAASLIAVFVVACLAMVDGGDASNENAAEKTAVEEGKPLIARGQNSPVHDDTLLDIGFSSFVPETRETHVVPVKESRTEKKTDTKLPDTQPFDRQSPLATEMGNPRILQQGDEPALVTEYEIPNVLRRNGWNEYVFRCRGRRIQLSINGHQAMDYTEPDESISQAVVIGLRIDVGPRGEACYKDIELTSEVIPCDINASGLGLQTSSSADHTFLFQSPCFGGNETHGQDETCAKSDHTERSAVEGVRTSSIRFLRPHLSSRPVSRKTR